MTTHTITSIITTGILRSLGPVLLGLALGAGAPACGGEGGGDAGTGDLMCEHGMEYECACTDGSMGTQMCMHDGSGFQPCSCEGDDVMSGTSAAEASAGTSEGSGSSGPEPGTGTSTGADGSTGMGTTTASSATSEETGPVSSPPTAQINHPGDGEARPSGVQIPFIGEASDPEDGVLAGASLVWVDSVQGEIGQGESFDAALLTLGAHTVTLTATDADGNVGEDSITLEIIEP